MQRIPLGVLVGSGVAVVMYSSGSVGEPFVMDEKIDKPVAADQYFFSDNSMAKSMDPSVALSRGAVALPRAARSKALA